MPANYPRPEADDLNSKVSRRYDTSLYAQGAKDVENVKDVEHVEHIEE